MYILLSIACVLGASTAAPSGGYGNIATIDSYSIPRYEFNYAVNDPATGDNKAQSEVREGGVVKGSYSLAEPDGTVRLVEYTADDLRGFNAVVKRIGPAKHPQLIYTQAVKPVVEAIPAPLYRPIPAPVYERIPAPIYEPIAEPIYKNIVAPIPSSYSISPNLYDLGYGGYEKDRGLGLELGLGGWNLGGHGHGH